MDEATSAFPANPRAKLAIISKYVFFRKQLRHPGGNQPPYVCVVGSLPCNPKRTTPLT